MVQTNDADDGRTELQTNDLEDPHAFVAEMDDADRATETMLNLKDATAILESVDGDIVAALDLAEEQYRRVARSRNKYDTDDPFVDVMRTAATALANVSTHACELQGEEEPAGDGEVYVVEFNPACVNDKRIMHTEGIYSGRHDALTALETARERDDIDSARVKIKSVQ